jgi:soluble P-type ATPase
MFKSNNITNLFYICFVIYFLTLIFDSEYRDAIRSIYIETYGLINKVLNTDIITDDNLTIKILFIDILSISPYILKCLSLLSILILLDRVPSSWYHMDCLNRINSRQYDNYISLIFNETLNYLTSIPNLITLSIGLIQAYSTTTIIPINLSYRLLIVSGLTGLTYLLYLFGFLTRLYKLILVGYIVSVSLPRGGIILYMYKGNYINIGVSCICLLFSIWSHTSLYLSNSKLDESYNGNIVSCRMGDKVVKKRSDSVLLGEKLIISTGEMTPATVMVDIIDILEIDIIDILEIDISDYEVGSYYDRESSGEDISRKFRKGDKIPPHRRLSRPNQQIQCHIVELVKSEDRLVRNSIDNIPHYLDNSRIICDFIGVCLILLIAVSISASAVAYHSMDQPNMGFIFGHLLAAAISANVLIPSMRMTLLYNIYHLILTLIFNNITVNSYPVIPKLSGLKSVMFDKTGTITEEDLHVANCYLPTNNKLDNLLEKLGWNLDELRIALCLANNESNIDGNGRVWGMSPEECEIVKYWGATLTTLINPLKNSGLLTFIVNDGVVRKVDILVRHPYCFGKGKLATIRLIGDENITISVRQDGTSFMSDCLSDEEWIWTEQIERDDPRRSMSIAWNLEGASDWNILSCYSFENPLRKGVPELMKQLRQWGLTVGILTGDGREAAEEVAKRAGFPMKNIFRILDEMTISEMKRVNLKQYQTISIEGKTLEKWLETKVEYVRPFLNNRHYNLVICRASRELKSRISEIIERGCYIGDASNDALAIQQSEVGIALRHGAVICRMNADIIMDSPCDLISCLTANGYRDMLLSGGERLLQDVCWLGGLTAGCLVVGLHRNGFQFLSNSLLYRDAWRPLPMLVITSIQYTISVIAYASSDCDGIYTCSKCLVLNSTGWHILGLIVGMSVAWTVKNHFPNLEWSQIVLHLIDIIVLTKHSLHCLMRRHRRSNRRGGGILGNQYIPRNSKYGFILNILDSVPARIILYAVFTTLPLW